MQYAPILIPTLCRYEHFKRCVESLKRNTHAEKTELIIGLDHPFLDKHKDGYDRIVKYISSIDGFKKVTIIKRIKNYGVVKNYIELCEYAFSRYESIIFTEDDNEFSPCFLDYMNKTLSLYKNEKKIHSISGYIPDSYYNLTQNSCLFVKGCNAWGFGLWKAKENTFKNVHPDFWMNILQSWKKSLKIFITCPMLLSLLLSMIKKNEDWGDVKRSSYNLLENNYQIRPNISLCRNWGQDGTGAHCSNYLQKKMESQKISNELIYIVEPQEVKNTRLGHRLFLAGLDGGTFNKIYIVIRIFLSYIKYRLYFINFKTKLCN